MFFISPFGGLYSKTSVQEMSFRQNFQQCAPSDLQVKTFGLPAVNMEKINMGWNGTESVCTVEVLGIT